MTPFGERLRKLRLEKNVTLKAMAQALGVSSAYLSALEHGKRGRPSWHLVQGVTAYFNIIWDDAEDLAKLAKGYGKGGKALGNSIEHIGNSKIGKKAYELFGGAPLSASRPISACRAGRCRSNRCPLGATVRREPRSGAGVDKPPDTTCANALEYE